MSAVLDPATMAAQARKALLSGQVRQWPEPDPSRETVMVGDRQSGVVASLPDDTLLAVLNGVHGDEPGSGTRGLIAMIETDAALLGIELKAGLPECPVDALAQPSPELDTAARRINRHALQARAILEEQRRREVRAAAQVERSEEQARALLAEVYAKAPPAAAALVGHARDAAEAWGRLAAFLRDLELVSEAERIQLLHSGAQESLSVAADVLGKPMPALPALPALPSYGELRRAFTVLGIPGHAPEVLLRSLMLPAVPSANQVREAAATLRDASN